MAEMLTHPEHMGILETAADKYGKRIFGWGMLALGVVTQTSTLVGLGLLSYMAFDMVADFAAKVRRGNTPVHAQPAHH